MRLKPSLTFLDAQALSVACLRAATERSVAVSVAVADEAGNLLHFARMDGARSYTVGLASAKSRVAATVGVTTQAIAEMHRRSATTPSADFPGIGGVPILLDGQCAGAVGISGSSPEIDEAIGSEAIQKLQASL